MKRSLFAELKRRNVFRAAILYVGIVWALSQGAAQLLPVFDVPNWAVRWFIVAAVIGFPFWLAFAWFFELTPEGLKLERDVAPGESITHHTGHKLDFWIIGVMAVAIVLLLTDRFVLRHGVNQEPAIALAEKSIAVLPFENLSADGKNDYFVAGVQDLVLTKLAGFGELKVISRTSTAKYASHPDDLRTIAGQLGVAHILEGSVQKAGGVVLINVQLIDARSNAHVWAQAYQRTLNDLFGVESEVAGKIADALKTKLSPAETKRLISALSRDAEANDLFLRAEYLATRARVSDINKELAELKEAIDLYRQALTRVPDFALAHARLASTLVNLAFQATDTTVQLYREARAEAERALQLAPDLAESHLALGACDFLEKGNYDAALKSYAVALQIRPNDAGAFGARGSVLRRRGKFDDAVDAYQQAWLLDPRDSTAAMQLGLTFMATFRYAEAEEALRHAMALDPDNQSAHLHYVDLIVLRSGDVERGLMEATGDSPWVRYSRVGLLTLQRNYRGAIALLEETGRDVIIKADLQRRSGEIDQARAFYAIGLPKAREQASALADHPLDAYWAWYALAKAELVLGNTSAGVAAIEASVAAVDRSGDRWDGPVHLKEDAALYVDAGHVDEAVSLLARALATPGIGHAYSPVMLWIDPVWDPIRKDPGFQALLEKYASYRPAKVLDASAP